MERFAATAERIVAVSAKLEKIALLAEYLRTLDDADLLAAVRFFSGGPFAARDHRTLSIGGRTIVETARRVWGFDDAALGRSYRATGDLGTALGPLVAPVARCDALSRPANARIAGRIFWRDRRCIWKTRGPAARSGSRARLARVRGSARRDVRGQDRNR